MNINKMWYIKSKQKEKKNTELNKFDPLLLDILNKRGYKGRTEIKNFLFPELADLFNPFKLKNMDKAIDRIIKAVKNDEKICVYGDYDVDGITAITVIYRILKNKFDYQIDYYVPQRLKEGYGLNKEAIKKIVENDCDLLITVDCGISACEEISFAKSRGLDVIITDHHQPGAEIPEALAVIDPHREEDSYPFQKLAGVGVVFKLCQALEKRLSDKLISPDLINIIDVVTLGTVADIVPLQGENRILVKKGLKLISDTKNIGLKKLLQKTGLIDNEITAGKIGYILAPPLNAAGRLENADAAIKLLTTESEKKAENIAEELIKVNKKRQKEEKQTLDEAINMIEQNIDLNSTTGIILGSDSWHPGVIGIVASRIVEKYYRPTVLIAFDNQIGRGSARSIKNLNIYQALNTCSDLFETYGGHAQAAGLSIKKQNYKQFKEQINSCFSKKLSKKDLIPALKLDSVITYEDINKKLVNDLNLLKPFGAGNPGPKFLLNNIRVKKSYGVGKNNKHLKIILDNDLEGIAFNFGGFESKIENKNIDLAFTPKINNWNGKDKVELKIKDINIREDYNHLPVKFIKNKCEIFDKRNLNYKNGQKQGFQYINNLLKSKQKIVVYNNKPGRIKIFKKSSDCNKIYNSQQQKDLNEFKKCNSGLFFFSRKKDLMTEINPDHLIFLSLPFSLNMFCGILKNVNFSEDKYIHLLFGEDDYYQNKAIIKNRLKKLDLSNSMSYNKTIETIEDFNKLANLIFKPDIFHLIKTIIENSK